MKIPRRINIMGHDYRIDIVPQSKLSPSHLGECEWPARIIRLSKELKGESLMAVLLHEFWHGVQFECGDMQIMQGQVQELHCDRFASIILSLKKQKVI